MSDCPTCIPGPCGLTSDLDLYNLDGPLYPFVLNCPPGSNCNGTGDNGEIHVTCGDDYVPVAIPAGATLEQKLALIGKALAGCGPKRVFDQPGPDNPGPIDPNGPPVQLYYSRSASCTAYCSEVVTVVNGAPVVTRSGPFTFTFPDGAFIGATQGAADNAARALACIRAKQHRFCLSAIQKAFCMDEGFTATIKARGQYISQFPFSDYWEISAGLPPGLTFHGGFISGGKAVIDGTPTTAGLYTFTVKVTLGSGIGQGDHMEQVYTLAIVEIDTETPLPTLTIDTPYTKNLTVIPAHDQETEEWSIVDGELPDGIELTKEGILHGTPTEAGAFPFTAQVTAIVNGTSITCEKDFAFTPPPYLQVFLNDRGTPFPAGKVGHGYLFNNQNSIGILSGSVQHFGRKSFTIRAWIKPGNPFITLQLYFFYNNGGFGSNKAAYNLDVVLGEAEDRDPANLDLPADPPGSGVNPSYRILRWSSFPGTATRYFVTEPDIGSFFDVYSPPGLPVSIFPRNQWSRVVCWVDMESLEIGLQLNDRPPVTTSIPPHGSPAGNELGFILGSNGGAGFYSENDHFDELGIWHDYVWTAGDRAADWNAGAGLGWPDVPQKPKLMAYFRFEPEDETVGGTIFNPTATIASMT